MHVRFTEKNAYLKFPYPPPPEKDEIKNLGAHYTGSPSHEWVLPLTGRASRWLVDHGVPLPETVAVTASVPADRRLAHPELDAPQQPDGLSAILFPYQRQGVAFLDATPRALLADEQGVGKTFQFLLAGRHTDRAIVLTPASSAWQTVNDGLRKLWPDLDAQKIAVLTAGTGRKQQALLDRLPAAQWIICPYSLVSKHAAMLARLSGSYTLIADEAQALKSAQSQRSKAALLLASQAERVVLATGSPLMNQKPIELYPLLQILGNPLGISYPQFGMQYCAGSIVEGFTRRDGRQVPDHYDFTGASHLDELRERLASFTIRRAKAEVLPDLPPKILTRVPVDLSPAYQRQYDVCANDYLAWRERYRPDLEAAKPLGPNAPIDLMLPGALRQIAAEAKAELAVEWVNDFLDSTAGSARKLIVFSDHLKPLDTVRAGLISTESVTIDGAITGEKREAARQRFQSDPVVRVCLAQTITAGQALNLTAADTVLFLNMPWRAQDVAQAFDRIHRPGQQAQSVQAVFLEMHTPGTPGQEDNIDAALYNLVLGKQAVVDALLGRSSTDLSTAGELAPDNVKQAVIAALGLGKTVAKATRQIHAASTPKTQDNQSASSTLAAALQERYGVTSQSPSHKIPAARTSELEYEIGE